jgi:hypothetical protein
MLKVDEQLAAVFRDRAAAGGGKKVDKSEHPIHSRQVTDANVQTYKPSRFTSKPVSSTFTKFTPRNNLRTH